MKSVALVVVAFGLLLAMTSPSLAHGPGHYYHYHHGYYHAGFGAVVVAPALVAPAPVYAYPAYSPVVTPACPPVVAPYYYGAPGVSLGYRGPGVSLGVHF